MKAILEFNLPEDDWNYRNSFHGSDLHSIIKDTLDHARKFTKYDMDNKSEDYRQAMDDIRSFIYELIREENLSIDF